MTPPIKSQNGTLQLSGRDNGPRNYGIDLLDEHIDEIEKDILRNILEKTCWNKTEAAKSLSISFRSMRYRLKKLGLSDD